MMRIQSLAPIIINGQEYLFMHDLQHILGLRKDEMLVALATLQNDNATFDHSQPDNTFEQLIGEETDTTEEAVAKVLCELKTMQVPLVEKVPFKILDIGSSGREDTDKGFNLADTEEANEGT